MTAEMWTSSTPEDGADPGAVASVCRLQTPAAELQDLTRRRAAEAAPLRCVCCSWCCESGRRQTPPTTRLFHNTRVAPHHCRRSEEPLLPRATMQWIFTPAAAKVVRKWISTFHHLLCRVLFRANLMAFSTIHKINFPFPTFIVWDSLAPTREQLMFFLPFLWQRSRSKC